MKYCSVLGCKTTNKTKGKVLHVVKKEWIDLVDWKTTNPSRICEDHFDSKYKKGSKKLDRLAKPHQQARLPANLVKLDHNYALPEDVGERWRKSEEKAKMYANRLYESNRGKRKLEEKIHDLESVLIACKKQCNVSDESLEVLKRAASEVPRELLTRAVKKIKCSYTPNYSPVLKKFALTLHLHSPAAYRYEFDMYDACIFNEILLILIIRQTEGSPLFGPLRRPPSEGGGRGEKIIST